MALRSGAYGDARDRRLAWDLLWTSQHGHLARDEPTDLVDGDSARAPTGHCLVPGDHFLARASNLSGLNAHSEVPSNPRKEVAGYR